MAVTVPSYSGKTWNNNAAPPLSAENVQAMDDVLAALGGKRLLESTDIASGPTGPTGPQGETGATGPTGPQGDVGPTGPAGQDGVIGKDGEPGATGPTGPTGAKGADGTGVTILGSYDTVEQLKAAHPTGNPGDSYLVGGYLYVWSAADNDWINVGQIQGPQGDTGPQGPQGPTGATGATGPTGATGATGPQGEQGNPGSDGAKGDTGPIGPTGPTGADGTPGTAGATGPTGPQGDIGPTGPSGKDGTNGTDGAKGDTGPTGPQGEVGPTGPSGADSTVPGPTGPTGATGPAGSYSFDAEPTMDSGNLVKSGGIFAAIPRLIASAGINIESFTGEDGKLSYVPSIDKTWLLDAFYPVGSIYQSVNSTSPATLFGGGTWERIEDKFLLAAGGTYAAGSTGGEASVSLTVEEIPSHDHTVSLMARSVYGGNDTYGALNNDGTNTYSYTTTATGGGQPHNNMPPYQAVYAWQRTA